MITRAYITEVITSKKVRVRIPIYDRVEKAGLSVSNDDLSIATICTPPNMVYNPQVGDVVFVGFEDNDISYPVVLGYMMTTKESRVNKDLNVTLTATSLKVKDSAELPSNLTFVSPNQERKILSFENIWSKVEDKQ